MSLIQGSALRSEAAAAFRACNPLDADDDDGDYESPLAAAAAARATTAKVPEVLQRLGLTGFGHLLGVCDLNQWSLKIDVPMRSVARRLLQVDEHQGSDAAASSLAALLPLALGWGRTRS
jgi:hypothetical protein